MATKRLKFLNNDRLLVDFLFLKLYLSKMLEGACVYFAFEPIALLLKARKCLKIKSLQVNIFFYSHLSNCFLRVNFHFFMKQRKRERHSSSSSSSKLSFWGSAQRDETTFQLWIFAFLLRSNGCVRDYNENLICCCYRLFSFTMSLIVHLACFQSTSEYIDGLFFGPNMKAKLSHEFHCSIFLTIVVNFADNYC